MRRNHLVIGSAALAALCAGCGSASAPPATGVTARRTAPDAVEGQVVSNRGGVVTVTSSGGVDGIFKAAATTPVTRVVTAGPADLAPGSCVVAGGQGAGGTVAVAWMLLEGRAGCARPRAAVIGRPNGLAVMGGEVQTITGLTVGVRGPAGERHLRLSVDAPVGRVLDATLSDVTEGRCVVALGRRDHSGPLLARHVHIVPAPAGGCFAGDGGVGALSLVVPPPGVGGPPGSGASAAGGGGPGPNGVSNGGTIDPSRTLPPVPQEPEGTGLTGPSSPPRTGSSAPPEFVLPPARPSGRMSSPPPTAESTPAAGPGRRGPAASPSPGARR